MRQLNLFAFILSFFVGCSAAIAGTNTLTTRSTGQTIQATFFNDYKTALTTHVVPRNSSGVATDEGGDNGTDTYRWRDGYFSRYIYVGTAAQQNRIAFGTNQLNFQINGVTEVSIGTSGLDAAGIAAGTLGYSAFSSSTAPRLRISDHTSNGSFVVPAGVENIVVRIVGGGGAGGAGGSAASGAAGAGGNGVMPQTLTLAVTAGETLTVTIGAGGTGGASAGDAGTDGAASTVTRSGTVIARCGGGQGGGGSATTTPGVADTTFYGSGAFNTQGGTGGAPAADGVAGADSFYASGGARGTAFGGGEGGSGGGGGAGLAAGGKGGNGGTGGAAAESGVAGAANSGAGGGGGGGADGASPGAGGNGGSGRVTIFFVGPA